MGKRRPKRLRLAQTLVKDEATYVIGAPRLSQNTQTLTPSTHNRWLGAASAPVLSCLALTHIGSTSTSHPLLPCLTALHDGTDSQSSIGHPTHKGSGVQDEINSLSLDTSTHHSTHFAVYTGDLEPRI